MSPSGRSLICLNVIRHGTILINDVIKLIARV
jgi:hypothetical protein